MSQSVLLTAAEEDTEQFRNALAEEAISLHHYPLERYEAIKNDEPITNTLEQLDQFENIVHGSKRNAQFFIDKVKEYGKLEDVRNQLNLALNQYTADFLEEEGVPAVHPHSDGKAINLMEFMLRIRRIGETLYPCGDKTAEDLPGFLQELDIPVQELVLFTLEGPEETELQQYRREIAAHESKVVIFHSRRSVNRMLAAFPNFNLESTHVVAGAQGVVDKLDQEDIEVDSQAEGSWSSILEKVTTVM